ncbi:MAG TPA: pectate lyase [Gemmatimonadaceae bacterium]|nr:pectate lyase [Gemmatimonadaceae bacterium]
MIWRRAAAIVVAFPAMGASQNPNPMDSIRKLPGYRPAADTIQYLATSRIERLVSPVERPLWLAYIARSRELYARDTAAMNAELRAVGKHAMTRAPYVHAFSVEPWMTPRWFASDSARAMAEAILSFQAPNGGWSKHVEFARPRRTGESYYGESADWEYISTIDNGSTTEEIRFLDAINRARPNAKYAEAIRRGVDYLLDSQMPTGCFPQVFPLAGSYHDAATFNDDATVHALTTLRDTYEGRLSATTLAQQSRASIGLFKGLTCIFAAQVRDNGKRAAWGQQHDPLTLAPVSARTYELTSRTALESAGILDFLMSFPGLANGLVDAVYAGVDWLRASSIKGLAYEHYELRADPNAPPIWGRLYEIGTNRVIMANRDGVKLYDWNSLTDRRSGYGWYTAAPAHTLATFEQWSRSHPRP